MHKSVPSPGVVRESFLFVFRFFSKILSASSQTHLRFVRLVARHVAFHLEDVPAGVRFVRRYHLVLRPARQVHGRRSHRAVPALGPVFPPENPGAPGDAVSFDAAAVVVVVVLDALEGPELRPPGFPPALSLVRLPEDAHRVGVLPGDDIEALIDERVKLAVPSKGLPVFASDLLPAALDVVGDRPVLRFLLVALVLERSQPLDVHGEAHERFENPLQGIGRFVPSGRRGVPEVGSVSTLDRRKRRQGFDDGVPDVLVVVVPVVVVFRSARERRVVGSVLPEARGFLVAEGSRHLDEEGRGVLTSAARHGPRRAASGPRRRAGCCRRFGFPPPDDELFEGTLELRQDGLEDPPHLDGADPAVKDRSHDERLRHASALRNVSARAVLFQRSVQQKGSGSPPSESRFHDLSLFQEPLSERLVGCDVDPPFFGSTVVVGLRLRRFLIVAAAAVVDTLVVFPR
mmetsp:Transcript_2130/g.5635  ORF Transcript_2130/g.5635 Transcript_2130/m.5635 type:complete len:459 (-) Transcript_2130:1060-2436(-)